MGESQEEATKRDFRKGNINFDFLQPEQKIFDRRSEGRGPDRRSGKREGKRGLFNRGRPPQPVGLLQIVLWACLLVVSVVGAVWIVFLGESLIMLLMLPFALAMACWSLLMVVLFQARPR